MSFIQVELIYICDRFNWNYLVYLVPIRVSIFRSVNLCLSVAGRHFQTATSS